MISKAVGRYLRISPRKVREVIALIKGKDAVDAQEILANTNKSAAAFLAKLLNSAMANAKRIPNIDEGALYISSIYADGGPSLKRFKAQAMGRASMIKRRTSHITVELDMKEPIAPAKTAKRIGKTHLLRGRTRKAQPVTADDKKTNGTKNKEAKKE